MKKLFKKMIIIYYNLIYKQHIYTTDIPIKLLFSRFKDNFGKEILLNKEVKIIGEISIDNYTYINGGYLYCGKIGKFCSMGYNISIGPGEHYTNKVSTYPINNRVCKIYDVKEFKDNVPPIIGNDVWVGNNVVILQGVNIGNGAVIASGAVVTKDVEPYSIVGGIPAKEIRKRFTQEQIIKLEKIKWWEWEKEKILKVQQQLEFDNIDSFISKFQT